MNVWDEFDSLHIERVWQELHERFGFPIDSKGAKTQSWRQDFREFMSQQKHSVTETQAFMTFGNKQINPILNGILRRSQSHPTFNKLVEFVIVNSVTYQDKISKQVKFAHQLKSGMMSSERKK